MPALLHRQLLVVTGKGGVGKTTIAAALGVLAAGRGLRTIVVEVGQESHLPALFGRRAAPAGDELQLEPGLWSATIDPDRALLEWLQVLGGRVSGRILASSGTFQYFAAAAPGARELVTMVKLWRLTGGAGRGAGGAASHAGGGARGAGRESPRAGGGSRGYDLVILDGPATGHALGMLASPHTFGAIARVGPIASQTRQLQELLETPSRSGYLAVALATEMAVTEALELQEALRARLGRGLDGVLVNALLPRRFSAAEMQSISALAPGDGDARAVIRSAAVAAQAVHDRARFQHNQLARLRRRDFEVLGIPFVWGEALELGAVRAIAEQLGRRL